jgi:hypothetical protein
MSSPVQQEEGTKQQKNPTVRLFTNAYSLMTVSFFATYIISILVAIYLFYLTPDGVTFGSKTFHNLQLDVFFWGSIQAPFSISADQLFLFVNMVFVLSFITSFFSNENYVSSVRRLVKKNDLGGISGNFLVIMPVISSAILFATSLIQALEGRVGIEVGGFSFSDPFLEILSLSYSSFVEEIGFRLVPLLFPVAIYLLYRSSKAIADMPPGRRLVLVPMALFKPSSFQKHLNISGGKGLHALELALLLISSALFSYAHILSGSWSIGKIPSAFLGGMVIGYCCLRYGFDSALLLHWFFNFYWSALSMSSTIGGPLLYLNDLAYSMTLYVGLLSLIVGVPYLVLKGVRGIKIH